MAIRVASAPVSWGIFEFTGSAPRRPFEQVLDEMAAAGYTGTELGPWGYLPTDPARLKEELDKRSLHIVSAFVTIRFADPGALDAGESVALRSGALLHALGCKIIVLADDNLSIQNRADRAGRIRHEDGLSAGGWKIFASGVDRVARCLMDQYGMAVAFHHQCGGFVETPAEIDRLMELTRPELVGLCLDTGHWVYGGGDSQALDPIKKYGRRINHMHFRDCDPAVAARARTEEMAYLDAVAAGLFCQLGRGSVDFKAIVEQTNALGFDGYAVVEQGVSSEKDTPLDSAKRSRAYLQSIGV
jgi:inosose dehydratase